MNKRVSRPSPPSLGLLLAVLCLLLVACEQSAQWQKVELPVLPDGVIELKVANVVNPRFKRLDEKQLQQVLAKTADMVLQHFGLRITFTPPDTLPIDQFFHYLGEPVKRARWHTIVRFGETLSDTDRKRMASGVYDNLSDYWNDREVVEDFARPYLLVPYEGGDFRQLSYALVDTLLLRLRYWLQHEAADGKSVIDGRPYNEWVWWDSIGYSDMPYDVVITNQLVASAETYDMSVHSSLRGGLTAGTTTYSRRGRFNAYAYVMVYPLINDNDMLAQLRDDAHYSADQVTTYAAAILTHELGHLLLHLGHPFGNQHCVMYPTPLLKYRDWYQGLDAAQCSLGSEQQMTPGVAKLTYWPQW